MTDQQEYEQRRARAARTAQADELSLTASDVRALVAASKATPAATDDLGRTLEIRLTEIAEAFVRNHHWQKPPPSRFADDLAAIRDAAKQLLSRLPSASKAQLRVRLTAQAAAHGADGEQRLRAAVTEVKNLLAWSTAAYNRQIVRVKQKSDKARHKGDQAAQYLYRDLLGVWIDFWHSAPDPRLKGPTAKFIDAFMGILKGKPAISTNQSLVAKLSPTLEQIRDRIRKL